MEGLKKITIELNESEEILLRHVLKNAKKGGHICNGLGIKEWWAKNLEGKVSQELDKQ